MILFFLCLPSSSFIIRPLPDAQHHWIVRRALEIMGGFSAEITDHLKHATEAIDGTPDGFYLDKWPHWAHYKPLGIMGGIHYTWDMARQNRTDWREWAAIYCGISPAWEDCLGVLFHSAADFYAHTNWVKVKSIGELANLEDPEPWAGLTYPGPGDLSSNPWFSESYADAVFASIREWHLFEDALYLQYPIDGTIRLNQEGVLSQVSILKPLGARRTLLRNLPAEGNVKGTYHDIVWASTAIPHDTPVKIELRRDDAWYADIIRANDPYPAHINDTKYTWDNYTCYDAQGSLKAISPDNAYPHYQIKIYTLEGPYYEKKSDYFYIQIPAYGAPNNLSAAPYGWGMISLTWQESSNCETGFEIWRKKEGDPNFTFLKAVGANIRATLDNTVAPDTFYYYLVRANYAGQNPSWSNETDCRVTSAAPEDLYYLEAELDWTYWSVKLTWTDNSNNEQGYEIERRSEWEPEFSVVDNVGPNTTIWYDPQTSNDTIYHYRVKVYNPSGFFYSPEEWVYVGKPDPVASPGTSHRSP
jgi:hypothetical protein